MNHEQLRRAARLVKAVTQNKIMVYEPYEKQSQIHKQGATKRERCFLAANQSGKTFSAGCEVSYHATGDYPDWWDGKRFDGPTRGWVAGTSAEGTRDTVQRILLGEGTNYGTGTIPKSSIHEVKLARSVSGAVGQIYVKHKSGGASYIGVRTYEQPVDRWAGDSLHWLWCDEEPPAAHYSEGLTRLNARQGIAFCTLTPLLGMTKFVNLFYPNPTTSDRGLTMMTIDDVGHYTEQEKAQIIASYQPFEVEARVRGIPMLGSGRVFPVTVESISCKPFEVPEHWPVLGGIDFGWDHPTGCISIAWDKDADCIYVTHAYKDSEKTPDQIAIALKHWRSGMPWVWPHDGHVHDKGSGITIASQYKMAGLRMMPEHATFAQGGHGLEAGLMEMLQRMQSGRFKVFHNLEPWFNEFSAYHRKNGLVVKNNDDLMSATRLCVMARHCARTPGVDKKFPRTLGRDIDPFSLRAM